MEANCVPILRSNGSARFPLTENIFMKEQKAVVPDS